MPDKSTGIFMFPAMILGPCLVSLVLTGILEGKAGLRDLGMRLVRWPSPARWLLALCVPPALILAVLTVMQRTVSPVYAPNFFWVGILFGIPAGLFEEIGWTGFALPRMKQKKSTFAASLLLGILWSCWHLPVVNYLGTATPHGSYWFEYFVVFLAAMAAMRVLISWLYANTRSVLLAQLMHISSTGSLVIFSA
ncbi:MAG: CPBP family intramembrane glutamic endopeptidase, partial [Terriglobales bacterium]